MTRDLKVLRERKKKLGLSDRKVAELSGVPFDMVKNIFSSETISIAGRTLLAIERALYPDEMPDPENMESVESTLTE